MELWDRYLPKEKEDLYFHQYPLSFTAHFISILHHFYSPPRLLRKMSEKNTKYWSGSQRRNYKNCWGPCHWSYHFLVSVWWVFLCKHNAQSYLLLKIVIYTTRSAYWFVQESSNVNENLLGRYWSSFCNFITGLCFSCCKFALMFESSYILFRIIWV